MCIECLKNIITDHSPIITQVMDIHTSPLSPQRNPTKNKLARLISLSPTFQYNMENVSTLLTVVVVVNNFFVTSYSNFKYFLIEMELLRTVLLLVSKHFCI